MRKQWVVAMLVVSATPALGGPPEGEARRLAERLLEAHGGASLWRQAPSVSYEHVLEIPGEADPWVSVETVEQGRRRVYQDWPRDGARLAYDGQQVWSLNWKRPNPPRFMVHLVYYFLNLPWLTQDPGVRLTLGAPARLPGERGLYPTLRMSFDPGVGDTPDDVYVIYVDPRTARMKATSYTVTYGAVLDLMGLPPGVRSAGPFIHVYEAFTQVDGLTLPVRYRTLGPDGRIYGRHTVSNWSLRKPFDPARLIRPSGALVDDSSTRRRGASLPSTSYDWPAVRVRALPVSGRVWMLAGAGGNIGVSVGPDGTLLVDDQYAPLVPKIEAALRGLNAAPPRFVINTHWHGDHTGGNLAFGRGALLMAQHRVRDRLVSGGRLSNGRVFAPAPAAAWPVLTYEHGLSLHFNGERVRAVHYGPGHTDGDTVVYFDGSRVVHMGDTFVQGGFLPLLDFASGGSLRGLLATLRGVLAELPQDARVIPGHGDLADKRALARYTTMLEGAAARVAALVAQGRDEASVHAAGVLRPFGRWDADSEAALVAALYSAVQREGWP